MDEPAPWERTAPAKNPAKDPARLGAPGYQRIARDAYMTPPWVAQAILGRLFGERRPAYPIWDPACGTGNIVRVAANRRWGIVASDIAPPVNCYVEANAIDFFAAVRNPAAVGVQRGAHIITNPPYGRGLCIRFLRAALSYIQQHPGAVLAALLPKDFDSAPSYGDVFADPAYDGVRLVTTRIRWFRESADSHGPRNWHVWHVWRQGRDPRWPPTIERLPPCPTPTAQWPPGWPDSGPVERPAADDPQTDLEAFLARS